MSTVIDTSVIIGILRGLPAAVDYVEGLEDVPACSEITRAEVTRGLRTAEPPPTERLFQQLRWVHSTRGSRGGPGSSGQMEKETSRNQHPRCCGRGNRRAAWGQPRHEQREALPYVQGVATPVSGVTRFA